MFTWLCHLGMNPKDTNSVLHSVSEPQSNSSPVLLHALVLSDNLPYIYTEMGYCSIVSLIMIQYLEHCITELDWAMCLINADTSTQCIWILHLTEVQWHSTLNAAMGPKLCDWMATFLCSNLCLLFSGESWGWGDGGWHSGSHSLQSSPWAH